MTPDVTTVAALMREVAAREIMPRFKRLSDSDVAQKNSPSDLVTTADLEAERCLKRSLEDLVPGSVVIGEEGAEADPDCFAALAGAAPVWLIDPVDGTGNFVRHEPCFAVIVAYCVAGETRAGWILDPIDDAVAWAVTGEGAWLDDGSRQTALHAAAPRPVGEMTGSLGFRLAKRMRARAETGSAPARIVRYGCTGREYMDLGRGVLDFARYQRLKPWDHAAGILIHREAGGFAALAEDERPYRPAPRIMDETVLLAPDQHSWRTLRTTFDEAL